MRFFNFIISDFYSVFLPETVPTTQAQLFLRSECLWVFIIFSFVYLRPVWLSTAPACLFIQNEKMKTLLTLRKTLLHWSSLCICCLFCFCFGGEYKSYFSLLFVTSNNCTEHKHFRTWEQLLDSLLTFEKHWFGFFIDCFVLFFSINFCLGSLASSTCCFVNVNTVNRF